MNATLTELSPCPDRLNEDQIRQFQDDGYLAFSDVLTPEEVGRAREALRGIVTDMLRDERVIYSPPKSNGKKNHGGATHTRADSPSMMQLEPGYDPIGRPADEVEMKVRKYMWFSDEAAVFQEMISAGSRLRGVMESVLGADPVLFQEMALVKPPFVGSEKPWHQDNAYFSVKPLDAIVGVWIALDDAGVENGCMHVIPGGHRQGAFKHHHGTDCEIDPALLDTGNVVPVPVPAGGAMFFFGMLPHETPPNRSPQRRRALQFHFRGANTEVVDEQEYDRTFVDRTGTAASCRAASRLGF